MKKAIQLLLLLFITQFASAQTIIHGADIINGELKDGYYFLLKIDDKILETEWKAYLDTYGRTTETEKHQYTLSKFNQGLISNNDLTIVSKVSSFKDFTKIFSVVEGVKQSDFNERAFNEFLLNFCADANYRELIRMAETDLDEAKKFLSDAEKDQKKIERSLESNLKTQEKYGKLLDASPEKMVSLLEEKKGIVEQQIGQTADEKTAEELAKAASKKEKEIAKNQKNEAKYAKKLEKTEAAFDELKDELFAAKRIVATAEALVTAKNQAIKDLKK